MDFVVITFAKVQDGYFFIFRIVTISSAMLTIRLSSSNVLINHHLLRKRLGLGESMSSGSSVKYIIFSGFQFLFSQQIFSIKEQAAGMAKVSPL